MVETKQYQKLGLLFAGIFLAIFLYKIFALNHPSWILFIAALLLGLISILMPVILKPFYIAWMGLGHILHRITNPLILAVMFFGVMTPIAFIFRTFSKAQDNRDSNSYWINRDQQDITPESLKLQF